MRSLAHAWKASLVAITSGAVDRDRERSAEDDPQFFAECFDRMAHRPTLAHCSLRELYIARLTAGADCVSLEHQRRKTLLKAIP